MLDATIDPFDVKSPDKRRDLELEIEAEGYEPGVCSATIGEDAEDVELGCELVALPRVGDVKGLVIDGDGAPVEGTIAWEPGASLEIGGVTLDLETDAAPAGKATTPQVTRTARSGGSGARRTASGGGHRASGGGSHSATSGSSHRATGGRRGAAIERTGSGKVQRRTRATPQKGIPTWLMLVFFAVGVLVVIQMLGNYADSSQEEAFDAKTSLARLEEALAEGKIYLVEIDVQGALQLKSMNISGIYVFIAAPDPEALRARLEGRGTETVEDLERRLAKAADENREQHHYDHVVVNDVLEDAVEEVRRIAGLDPCRSEQKESS